MACLRCGSISRSLISKGTTSSIRSSLPRLRPSTPPLHSSPFLFSLPRTLRALACTQSLMPLLSVVADTRLASHIPVEARACCELSQGATFDWVRSTSREDYLLEYEGMSHIRVNVILTFFTLQKYLLAARKSESFTRNQLKGES